MLVYDSIHPRAHSQEPLIYFCRGCRSQVSSAFIACIPFRLVCLWYFLLLIQFSQCVSLSVQHLASSALIQYVTPPFQDRFSWCVASFVLECNASFWSCIHIFYTLRSVFFLYACSFAYPVVCRVFIHVRCCLRFLFRNQFQYSEIVFSIYLFVRQCYRS